MSGETDQYRDPSGRIEPDGGKPAIDISELTFSYPDGTEAVSNISLRIPQGEFFGFLGPNGAGKTTVIKTIVTLLRPTGGRVEVFGRDVEATPQSVRERIGYMAQETSIDAELTARENIEFAAETHHLPRDEHATRIDELLDLVGLADVADKRAGTFSGGMKKRLDAATALVHDPPLVFLDEPTTGLDPRARNRLWEYFHEISERGATVFLTTQYLEEADELADRIGVIADGEMIASGTPTELKAAVGGDVLDIVLEAQTDAARERARTQVADADLLGDGETVAVTNEGLRVTSTRASELSPDVLAALRDGGVGIASLNLRSPTLDDVFLALTGEGLDAESPEGEQSAAPAIDHAAPEVE
ncbi:MAG: ATP-binding cassette domain-containing protein [Halobacteriales archaeon]